jgi:hypothetical protein
LIAHNLTKPYTHQISHSRAKLYIHLIANNPIK